MMGVGVRVLVLYRDIRMSSGREWDLHVVIMMFDK